MSRRRNTHDISFRDDGTKKYIRTAPVLRIGSNLLDIVLSYLQLSDYAFFRLTCRTFYDLTRVDKLWEKIDLTKLPLSRLETVPEFSEFLKSFVGNPRCITTLTLGDTMKGIRRDIRDLFELLPGLQSLEASCFSFDQAFLDLLPKSVPSLTSLTLFECEDLKGDAIQKLTGLNQLTQLSLMSVPITCTPDTLKNLLRSLTCLSAIGLSFSDDWEIDNVPPLAEWMADHAAAHASELQAKKEAEASDGAEGLSSTASPDSRVHTITASGHDISVAKDLFGLCSRLVKVFLTGPISIPKLSLLISHCPNLHFLEVENVSEQSLEQQSAVTKLLEMAFPADDAPPSPACGIYSEDRGDEEIFSATQRFIGVDSAGPLHIEHPQLEEVLFHGVSSPAILYSCPKLKKATLTFGVVPFFSLAGSPLVEEVSINMPSKPVLPFVLQRLESTCPKLKKLVLAGDCVRDGFALKPSEGTLTALKSLQMSDNEQLTSLEVCTAHLTHLDMFVGEPEPTNLSGNLSSIRLDIPNLRSLRFTSPRLPDVLEGPLTFSKFGSLMKLELDFSLCDETFLPADPLSGTLAISHASLQVLSLSNVLMNKRLTVDCPELYNLRVSGIQTPHASHDIVSIVVSHAAKKLRYARIDEVMERDGISLPAPDLRIASSDCLETLILNNVRPLKSIKLNCSNLTRLAIVSQGLIPPGGAELPAPKAGRGRRPTGPPVIAESPLVMRDLVDQCPRLRKLFLLSCWVPGPTFELSHPRLQKLVLSNCISGDQRDKAFIKTMALTCPNMGTVRIEEQEIGSLGALHVAKHCIFEGCELPAKTTKVLSGSGRPFLKRIGREVETSEEVTEDTILNALL